MTGYCRVCRMPRLVVEVPEDIKAELEELALDGDRSLAAETRKALVAYLERSPQLKESK
jgi:predicted transcriptional regulator